MHGPPKIVCVAVDLYEHLVQVPPSSAGFDAFDPAFSYLRREHWTETMPPKSHSFVTDIDAALVQQIFNIPKGQRKPHIQHHRQADNLAARFEVANWVRFGHIRKVRNRPARLKLVCSASTV